MKVPGVTKGPIECICHHLLYPHTGLEHAYGYELEQELPEVQHAQLTLELKCGDHLITELGAPPGTPTSVYCLHLRLFVREFAEARHWSAVACLPSFMEPVHCPIAAY